MPYLIIETRGNTHFTLLEKTTLGRLPENDLALDDRACSGRHAVIRREGGAWVLEDLESTNGTWINDQRIAGPWALKEGDRICVGAQILRVAGLEASCRRCGRALPAGIAFCPGCGLSQKAPPSVPPPIPAAVPPPVPSGSSGPPPIPVASVQPPPLPVSSAPRKQELLHEIALRLGTLGIPFETATRADVLIRTVFLDASWGTGNRKIEYEASALLNDADRTLYFYELTKESSSGLSFGGGHESSFQSGRTLSRKIRRVGYGPDGKAYEITLDLGAINGAFQEAAITHGWRFQTVLKREKASYRKAAP